MTASMPSFYEREGSSYRPLVATRGPWSAEHQHGGPPAALLCGVLETAQPDHALARLAVQLHRAVPLAPLEVELGPATGGRTVQRVQATLRADGRVVATAEGLFVRRTDTTTAVSSPPAFPAGPPDAGTPFVFPFFPWDEGYHQAIELRLPPGVTWGGPSIALWARSRCTLLPDTPLTPAQSAVVLADAQSGFAPPAAVTDWTFVNPELTVSFARPPRGTWRGLVVRSAPGPEGCALATSALFDRDGVFGQASQVMVLTPR